MSNPSAIHTQITEPRIAKFSNRNQAKDLFIRDTSLQGFGLRISPNNAKSFFIEATIGGKFVRRVIGRHPLVSLSEARNRALEALRDLRLGLGQRTHRTSPDAILRPLSESFLEDKRGVLRASTIRDYESILRGSYFAPWHARPVKELRRQEVLERYRFLCTKHGVPTANRCMRVLSVTLNYGRAVLRELEDWSNPVRVLADARAKRPVKPRTSHIPKEQLATWLAALDDYRTHTPPQQESERREDIWLLLHLLLMTGMRSNEARSLRWSDVDLEGGTFVIRQEIAKNGHEVRLPLNAWLVGQLKTRPRSANGRIFAASSRIGYIDNLRRPLGELQKRSGLRIRAHDLRRTFATYLDSVGAPFGVIKQLLNHVSTSDVTAQYVQHRGLDELRRYSDGVAHLISRGSPLP